LHCKRFAKEQGVIFLVFFDTTHSVASNNYHLVIIWCPEPDVSTQSAEFKSAITHDTEFSGMMINDN